jgi:fumarate hydratase class I
MVRLTLPCHETVVRNLRVGDAVWLSGRMITGRDTAHHWLNQEFRTDVAPFLKDTVIYHCGPVVRKHGDGNYSFVAAGPTTSSREEPYQADIITRYGLRGVIGKGGMFRKTQEGLQRQGAVYLHAVGGTAQLLAQSVTRVVQVFQLAEFGVPEAMWVIEVKDFPTVVTMDAHGSSLHDRIAASSEEALSRLLDHSR